MEPFFVDCHSHVCPSGDDGVPTVSDGVGLCRDAHLHGTALLFATPHVWPSLPLTAAREAEVRTAFERMRPVAGLELRLGWELTPSRGLLQEDPRRYELEGTGRVLMEVPFTGAIDILLEVAEHIERAGLEPVIAHPERTEAILARPELAELLAERWPLQVNASSLTGRHGAEPEQLGWSLVDRGLARVVASDGHRQSRPPRVDEAYRLVVARLGEERARPLFDGSALGLSAEPQRAVSAGA